MTEELFTREGQMIAPEKRSGPKSYTFKDACHRCGGQGGSDAWKHTGWKCFRCGGERFELPRTVKLYTTEELAKLNARRDAIRAKKQAVRDAKAAEEKATADAARATWEATNGNGELVERARKHAEKSAFIADLLSKLSHWLWTEKQADAVRGVVEKIEAREAAHAAAVAGSEWQGAVGDRLEAEVTVANVYSFERAKFGAHWLTETCNIVTMITDAGHVFVSKTPAFYAEKGERLAIKGTVKKHDSFKDVKQTVISRVAVVKEKAPG